MLHKVISSGLSGSGIAYLMHKKRAVEPTVLRGDPTLVAKMIAVCPSRHPCTTGCLTFQESALHIDPVTADAVMDSYEALVLAGLAPLHIARTWILHADKPNARMELNAVFLNQDQSTGKILAPYVHQRDSLLFRMWAELENRAHGWTSANADENYRGYAVPAGLPRRRAELHLAIGGGITAAVGKGKLCGRGDVLSHLIAAGYTVVTTTKTKVAVLDAEDGQKLWLRGDYYHEDWAPNSVVPSAAAMRRTELAQMPTAQLHAELADRAHRRAEILSSQARRMTRPSARAKRAVSNLPSAVQQPQTELRTEELRRAYDRRERAVDELLARSQRKFSEVDQKARSRSHELAGYCLRLAATGSSVVLHCHRGDSRLSADRDGISHRCGEILSLQAQRMSRPSARSKKPAEPNLPYANQQSQTEHPAGYLRGTSERREREVGELLERSQRFFREADQRARSRGRELEAHCLRLAATGSSAVLHHYRSDGRPSADRYRSPAGLLYPPVHPLGNLASKQNLRGWSLGGGAGGGSAVGGASGADVKEGREEGEFRQGGSRRGGKEGRAGGVGEDDRGESKTGKDGFKAQGEEVSYDANQETQISRDPFLTSTPSPPFTPFSGSGVASLDGSMREDALRDIDLVQYCQEQLGYFVVGESNTEEGLWTHLQLRDTDDDPVAKVSSAPSRPARMRIKRMAPPNDWWVWQDEQTGEEGTILDLIHPAAVFLSPESAQQTIADVDAEPLRDVHKKPGSRGR